MASGWRSVCHVAVYAASLSVCALGQGGQQAPPAGSSNAQDAVASFGTTVVMPSGLRGLVYFLAEGTIRLPDLSKRRPVGIIYTSLLNVPPRDFTTGSRGIPL
jgi:hypothetical protein